MIIAVAIVCLFAGAAFGYLIAERQSQHAIFAARAKGILDGRSDAECLLQRQRLDLQRLRLRIWRLEAKDRAILTKPPT
jgi:hypothetical protein